MRPQAENTHDKPTIMTIVEAEAAIAVGAADGKSVEYPPVDYSDGVHLPISMLVVSIPVSLPALFRRMLILPLLLHNILPLLGHWAIMR